ncbi:MAG: hypothetical protein ACOYKE_08235 [Ferruginibacter sp.]
MPKSRIFFIILLLCFGFVQAQQKVDTVRLSAQDSITILNELAALLNQSSKATSYFSVNVEVGNQLFSIRNKSLNSRQAERTMVFTPSIGYFHKSGLSISANTSLLNDQNTFGPVQFAINPAYDLPNNKNIALGLSYTHYWVKDSYSSYASPIQHDLYGSFQYKKKWLQPGLALGYSSGKYNELRTKDTVINGNRKIFYDSITYALNSFTMMLSVAHSFEWEKVLNEQDNLVFTPSILFNLGAGKTSISHITNAPLLFRILNRRGRIPKLQTDKFQPESIGVDLNLQYYIGKFSIEPEWYLDYYVASTTGNRFTQNITFKLGFYF